MLIINKLFHKWAGIYKVKTKDKTIIDGRIVNQKNWYQLRFSPLKKKQDHCFVEDGYLWLQFRKREMADVTNVFNMEIEEDHSYIVQGVISKNCQDLSVAGKREGLAGERSGLFRTAIDIVHRLRDRTGLPRYFVWENVPGAFSSNKGFDFKAVLEEITKTEIPMPRDNKWAESGMVEWGGTSSLAWRTLDAQYWGVPQRRKRIFLIADFRGFTAGEILFVESGLPWDSAESREAGEGTAIGAEGSSGSASLLRMRSGCPGGGKGPLISEEKSLTLATNNDQYLFTADKKQVAYSMSHDIRSARFTPNITDPLTQTDYKEPPAVLAITGETFFEVGKNVCPTLKRRDYKEPIAVCASSFGGYSKSNIAGNIRSAGGGTTEAGART